MKAYEVYKKIVKINGYLGLFRGFCVTFNRDVSGGGLYFTTYYYLRDYGENNNILTVPYLLLIGGIAGI